METDFKNLDRYGCDWRLEMYIFDNFGEDIAPRREKDYPWQSRHVIERASCYIWAPGAVSRKNRWYERIALNSPPSEASYWTICDEPDEWLAFNDFHLTWCLCLTVPKQEQWYVAAIDLNKACQRGEVTIATNKISWRETWGRLYTMIRCDEFGCKHEEFYKGNDCWQPDDVDEFGCEQWSDEGGYIKRQNEIDEYGWSDKLTKSTNTVPGRKIKLDDGFNIDEKKIQYKFGRLHEKRYDKSDYGEELRQCWQFYFEWCDDEDSCDKRRKNTDQLSYTGNGPKTLRTCLR